jgi:hypothetical protein
MNTQEAYELGKNHGHGFACHNVPRLGDKLSVDDMGRVTVDAENIREVHQGLCFAAESNSRSYSPFEFTANAFNESEDSDALWQAYDSGIADAIFADLATYTNEDYGLED